MAIPKRYKAANVQKGVMVLAALTVLACVWVPAARAVTPEPVIADYTNYPIFQINAVTPNILIILDNSGSMNYNAYGSYPGDGGTVTEPFNGAPYCGIKEVAVAASGDDAEEHVGDHGVWNNSADLDFGGYYDTAVYYPTIVGVRFQNVEVPQGRTITNAYIQFTGSRDTDYTGEATSLTIWGQDEDAPDAFSTANSDISSRTKTTASAAWNALPDWTNGQRDATTRSPDLTAVVQEIVSRPGWQKGNAMTFIVEGTGKRDVKGRDAGSSSAPVLHIEFDYEDEDCTVYYGYFDPTSRYNWDGSKFVRNAAGAWEGNWMNWCTMRRVDVLRKVLMGGLATARTGGGNQVNYCETPTQTNRYFQRRFTNTAGTTPYNGECVYGVRGGYLYVDTDADGSAYDTPGGAVKFDLRVQKDVNFEPLDFMDGNLSGVLQRVGDRARWGNEWFYEGTGINKEGGFISNRLGTNMTTLITDLQNTGCDTNTPLAEAYYVAMQHFKQEEPDTSLGFKAGASLALNLGTDPYYYDTELVHCAKSFVILLTDGASTKDGRIPAALKDVDNDGDNTACDEATGANCDYSNGGSDFLDDVALYARTNDLRADLDGDQNMLLYTIYAFGSEADARGLLQDASRNGGFTDRNGNNRPDLDEEWDLDGNGVPDTYFEAQDGYELERQLMAAIFDILRRAASGTAVSVLATKGEGEGTLVQAFFKPAVATAEGDIKWVGYLQSLWVDRYGNTREDTNGNHALDTAEDNIVQFYLDPGTGETRVKVFHVSSGREYPDNMTWTPDETIALADLSAIWEAGDKLADRDPDERRIFTYTGSTSAAIQSDKFIELTTANAAEIRKFLGVESNATWGYLGDTYPNRVNNIIHFVRGVDDDSSEYQGSPTLRPRTIDGRLWKLGDIVYSTPMSIAGAVESYHVLYDDSSYREYVFKYRNRETVVYVGANDGMLHAFTSGVYKRDEQQFYSIHDANAEYDLGAIPDSLAIGDVPLGSELWAYIPQNLLAHLKWLPYEEYTHVYYVDLKPKVIDAKIFAADNATHPGGWGTVLIGGLNLGGKQIETDNGTYRPCFFAIDITNPRNPQFLWERAFANLGFSTNQPCTMSVGNRWTGSGWADGEWYLAIGSGPTAYDGSSTQNGHLYIVDLATGGQTYYRDFTTTETNTYMNAPAALDKGMNYNVDAVYAAANFATGASRLYKVLVPQTGSPAPTEYDPFITEYETDPANWLLKKVFYCPKPITAPVSLSIDKRDNCWIFGGTGRYMTEADKTSTAQNILFGIKDPFFNAFRDDLTCFHKYSQECEINTDNNLDAHLFDSGVFAGKIKAGGTVEGVSGITTFGELLEEARKTTYDGWYRELCSGSTDADGACLGTGPSERLLNKPAILGGIVLYPTFSPNSDVCGFGGNGRLFALFYETGTAYKNRVVGEEGQETILDVIGLGEGLSSSFGVHVGKEKGGMLYGQMSTGVIEQIDITPAFTLKGTPIYWREEP